MRFLACLVFVTGCIGTIDAPTGGGSVGDPLAPDGGTAGGGSGVTGGGGSGSGSGSGTSNCRNQTTPPTSGHHNAGQDCMNGCHDHGFTLAGTLYTAAGAAEAGGTITVSDANGATFDMVSGSNGNFYTSQTIAFPITVFASACPTSISMSSAVTSGNGGCNKSGCHATGAQGHIHL